MTIIRKFLFAAACVSAIVLGGASAVSAATYGGATLTGPGTAVPGGTMALSGSGFLPNAPITITINPGGVVITGVFSDASGSWSASVAAPSTAGTYTVSATDGVNTSSTSVVVSASGGGSALPVTGNSSSLPLAQLGAGLLAVGALIAFGVRRSSSKRTRQDVSV